MFEKAGQNPKESDVEFSRFLHYSLTACIAVGLYI